MQNLEDLKEKIFFEAKNIIETLSKISSSEELLLKKELIEELDERISFIKILEKNEDFFRPQEKPEFTGDTIFDDDKSQGINATEEEPMEEEVRFTNELNDIRNEDDEPEAEAEKKEEEPVLEIPEIIETFTAESDILFEPEPEPQTEPEPVALTEEAVTEEITAEAPKDDFEETYRRNVEAKEKELHELEERRRKIVDIEKPAEPQKEEIHPDALSAIQEEHHEHEKKFKLAHIKGLKSVQSLFDDDPLEHIQDAHTEIPKEKEEYKEPASLLKTNIPTDFMEAEKPKPDLRLDLNDKIAFSKTLFSGSQSELNEALRHINSCKNAEEAKEYLSDLYYEKNWKKVDEFAQRLWLLVENKFL